MARFPPASERKEKRKTPRTRISLKKEGKGGSLSPILKEKERNPAIFRLGETERKSKKVSSPDSADDENRRKKPRPMPGKRLGKKKENAVFIEVVGKKKKGPSSPPRAQGQRRSAKKKNPSPLCGLALGKRIRGKGKRLRPLILLPKKASKANRQAFRLAEKRGGKETLNPARKVAGSSKNPRHSKGRLVKDPG